MMKRMKAYLRTWKWVDWLLLAGFAAAVVLTTLTTLNTSLNLLDGDASGEMVLARHLYDTGRILSEDWYYTTELRAVQVQLVLAPLFAIFDSWRRVRFVGTMILQMLMVGSYGYMRKAGLGRRGFLASAALMLLPVSVSYGRIVLYHLYYIPYIILGFFAVGLLLAVFSDVRKRSWIWFAVHMGVYALVTFCGAFNGFRQLSSTQGPVMLAALWLFVRRHKESDRTPYAIMMA